MDRNGIRRATLTSGMVIAVVLALAAPALAFAGGGASWTIQNGRSVQGAGTFVLDPVIGSSSTEVTLECSVVAEPAHQVVTTMVESCELSKGTTVVATAPPSARQSPAWVTVDRTTASLEPAGAFMVCWEVRAIYEDTTQLTNEDCGLALLP